MPFSFSPMSRTNLLRWLLLMALSALLSSACLLLKLPAALLMGPMAAAILLSIRGGSLKVPPLLHLASQGMIGVMIARILSPSVWESFRNDWGLTLVVVTSTVTMASVLGWVLGRLRILPGTTPIWGLSPGAASVMMVMAESYGADARLVAFMQYLRVVIVVTIASLVVRFLVPDAASTTTTFHWPGATDWQAEALTALVALVGAYVGRCTRIPAGGMLLPMGIGALLQGLGILHLVLFPPLLAASYALLGWGIGLGFSRGIILHALRALPQTILAILVLVFFSGGLAFLLVREKGLDPLTAYLATSPGGMDSVAIIAAATHRVDTSFVMVVQTVRFLVVLLVGPVLSRFLANRMALSPIVSPEPRDPALMNRVLEDEDELD